MLSKKVETIDTKAGDGGHNQKQTFRAFESTLLQGLPASDQDTLTPPNYLAPEVRDLPRRLGCAEPESLANPTPPAVTSCSFSFSEPTVSAPQARPHSTGRPASPRAVPGAPAQSPPGRLGDVKRSVQGAPGAQGGQRHRAHPPSPESRPVSIWANAALRPGWTETQAG